MDVGPTTRSPVFGAGRLRLSGNGSVLKTSAFDIRAGGTLSISTLGTGITNRVADTTSIDLRGGALLLDSTSDTGPVQSEVMGPISMSGFSSITVGPNAAPAGALDLKAASLTRLERGTMLFRNATFGFPTSPTPDRILFASAPAGMIGGGGAGPNTSILPYTIGDPSMTRGGTGLVTYDATDGVRFLNPATDYSTDLATAAPTHDVRLTATVNALLIEASAGGLTGTGTLSVRSVGYL